MSPSRWWFATLIYAAISVILFGLAWRSFAAYGRELELSQLLDPRTAYTLIAGRSVAMIALLYLMGKAVWKRMPELIVLAFALSFLGGFADVVYFSGIEPKKLDFRPLYPAVMSQILGWTSFACFLSSVVANFRLKVTSRH